VKPFSQGSPALYSLRNTGVSFIVDISKSMASLSSSKLMSAQIFCTGVVTVLAIFGVQMHFFAFADREAIWRLSEQTSSVFLDDLLRLIDALRTGGRPGSCPLDSILNVRDEWNQRRLAARGALLRSTNHLSIVISDFLSAQAPDQSRDWSSQN
jgi:hypothetical protein